MSFLLIFLIRLLPIGLIVFLRQGHIQPWLVGITVLIISAMVLVGLYIDFLRLYISDHEAKPVIVDPVRNRIGRLAPLHFGLIATYLVMLILLALV